MSTALRQNSRCLCQTVGQTLHRAIFETLEARQFLTAAPTSVPNAPFALTATAVASNEIDLAWVDNNDGPAIDGYNVLSSGNVIATLPSTASSFDDLSLIANSIHTYSVEAFNAVGPSSLTAPVTATTLNAGVTTTPVLTNPGGVPNGPFALSAALIGKAGAQTAQLQFIDNSTNEAGFVVQITGTDGTSLQRSIPAQSDTGIVTYNDPLVLTPGASYTYQVYAINGPYQSSVAGPVSLTADATTPLPPTSVPNGPFALTATAISDNQINLSWIDNTSGPSATGFSLTVAGSTGSVPVTLGANATSYTTTGLSAGTSYVFSVAATNDGGASSAAQTTATTAGVESSVPGQNGNVVTLVSGSSASGAPTAGDHLVLTSNTGTVLKTVSLGSSSGNQPYDGGFQQLTIGPTGKIIVVGVHYDPSLAGSNTPSPLVVEVFNTDLTPDSSFGTNGRVQLSNNLPQGVGSVIAYPTGAIGVYANESSTMSRGFLLTAAGVPSLALKTSSGSVLATGADPAGFPQPVSLTEYNSDGTVYTGFGTSGSATIPGGGATVNNITALEALPNAILVEISGGSSSNSPYIEDRLALLSTGGSLLNTITLGSGRIGTVPTIHDQFDSPALLAVTPTGKVVVAGYDYQATDLFTNQPLPIVVEQFNSDLTPDTSFGTNGRAEINPIVTTGSIALGSLTVNMDGSILVLYTAGSNSGHALTLSLSGAVLANV